MKRPASDEGAPESDVYPGARPPRLASQVVVGADRPDLTLLLDLPPEQGLERAAARRGLSALADRFEGEGLEFHRTLRAAFLAIARDDPERCVVIDAGADEDSVAAAVWAAVRARLGAHLSAAEP